MEKTKSSRDFFKAVSYFGAALLFVLSAVYFSNLLDRSQAITPIPVPATTTPIYVERPIIICQPSFVAYQELKEGKGQTVPLIGDRQSMYAENGKFVNSKVVLAKSETETSKVACGYLFIRAGTDIGAVQPWENIYINPSGFGGHLKSDSSISINDGEKFSEYLYALNKIEYWSTRNRQTVNTADWAALLNVQQTVPFTIALNTENQTGFIDEMVVAYKCWNPKDGTENKDCKLRVESSETSIDSLR